MRESQIVYENGDFWVLQVKGLFHVMHAGVTHSKGETTAYADRSLAVARVDYLARKKGK